MQIYRKADQDTNNMYTLLVPWHILFSVVHLLISWYLFLVVHFVGISVLFPGCTLCWYPGTFRFLVVHFVGILVPSSSWLYTLLVSWYLQVPGCTLCWYPGAFKFLVVHFVGILVLSSSWLYWYLGTFSWLWTWL